MPRVARLKIAAIEDLYKQLEYAPPETRRRHMDAVERLVGEIDPSQNYPEDFIIFRITGYRSDRHDEPMTLVGQALLPDLVNLVQMLSERLAIDPASDRRKALSLEQVAERLRVSQKTIQRYRRQGLVFHYVQSANGVPKLACFEDALNRFANGHREKVDDAATFSRLGNEAEASIIEEARSMRNAQRLSLNSVAKELAKHHARAHETIRMMLRRYDRTAAQPIFTEPGPLTDRRIALIYRAWQRGIEPARLAARFGKSKPTIHRAVNRKRRDLLRTVKLTHIKLPTFDLPEAADVILATPAVTAHLLSWPLDQDVLAYIEIARTRTSESLDVEHSIVAAYNLLKLRASTAIAELGEWPRSEMLESIETDLRWISLLQWRLIALGFPAALRRIEQNLGRPLSEQTREQILYLVRLAINMLSQAVQTLDPSRDQRLDRIASYGMERALVKLNVPLTSTQPAVRHQPGPLLLRDVIESKHTLNPWDSWLNIRPDLMKHVHKLNEQSHTALSYRHGLEGFAPMRVDELAKKLGIKSIGAMRLLQSARRELREIARQNGIFS